MFFSEGKWRSSEWGKGWGNLEGVERGEAMVGMYFMRRTNEKKKVF